MTRSLRRSERVPMHGVTAVERDGQGKAVDTAWLHLEERHGPTPPRHVVTIRTMDGAVYRFQRYDRDEFLAFYDRQNPDGSEFQRAANLPEHVEAVRRAIMDGDVLPDFEALLRAEVHVGAHDDGEATDADVRLAVNSHEAERRRTDEATMRAGYAVTDGGETR
jgi:hypothetical protein